LNWKKRLNDGLKFLLILSFLVPLLAGCVPGEPLGIAERYPLESVGGSGGAASYVYRASDRSVPEVAQELIASREPDQQSAEDP